MKNIKGYQMNKKIIIGFILVVVLAIGFFVFNLYKGNQGFDELRSELYEGYIPAIKEVSEYIDEYLSYSTDLERGSWQVEEGFDMNLKLRKSFEEAKLEVTAIPVESEEALRLKDNVLVSISLVETILDETYESSTGEDELTNQLDLLSNQVDDMNELLRNN